MRRYDLYACSTAKAVQASEILLVEKSPACMAANARWPQGCAIDGCARGISLLLWSKCMSRAVEDGLGHVMMLVSCLCSRFRTRKYIH